MKRFLILALLGLVAVTSVDPAFAARDKQARRGPKPRTVIVVRPGHPIRRSLPRVYVHPVRGNFRVSIDTYLPLRVWRPAVIVRPAPDRIVWQDSERLYRAEGWTEFTLNADSRGDALLLDVRGGKVRFDFAEVVFENGDCQVVDFSSRSQGPGLYPLLDFRDGRRVDHVRVIARAETREVTVGLLMQK
jgi:hypothetical protein